MDRPGLLGTEEIHMLCTVFATAVALASPQTDAALAALQSSRPGLRTFTAEDGMLSRLYGTTLATGRTSDLACRQFIDNHLDIWGVDMVDLEPVGPFPDARHTLQLMPNRMTGGLRFTATYWRQTRDGIPVHDSRLMLLVRNEPGSPLVLASAQLHDLGDWHPAAAMKSAMEIARRAASAVLGADALVDDAPTFVIWVDDDAPTLAVDAIIRVGTNGQPGYDTRRLLIDAHDGTVLLDESRILNCGLGQALAATALGDVSGQVLARAGDGWSAQECDPMSTQGMPWARVSGGGQTVIADADGFFSLPSSGTITVTSQIDGQYFTVNNQGGADGSVDESAPDGSAIELLHNISEAELTTAETNAYIHANETRDFVLYHSPQFPVIDTQTGFPVNVNITDTCNAYYDYSSINFYQAGGSCNNTAFGHVVMHEYGHHLVASAGSGQGEYGEGMADCIAVIMTGDSRMGPGFYVGNCATGIRDADNDCQASASCSTCGGAIHSCGQLISGCVWSTWQALQNSSPMDADQVISDLTVNSIPMHNGTSIDEAIAIDFLMLDDDDADLDNGTPHYQAISLGFEAHGINVPALAWLNITLLDGEPDWTAPNGGTVIQFRIETGLGVYQPGSVRVFAGPDGILAEAVVQDLGDDTFEFAMPPALCGSMIEWFISAQTVSGDLSFLPTDAPGELFSTIAAWSQPVLAFMDDCTTDPGWTVGGDATDGFWERGIPAGGNNRPQADCDMEGSFCWLTENTQGGGGDVDGGSTILTSPLIDATGVGAGVSYCWWYRNIGGGGNVEDDIWVVSWSPTMTVKLGVLLASGRSHRRRHNGRMADGDAFLDRTWPTSRQRDRASAFSFIASDLNETSRVSKPPWTTS